jgi:predicted HTH transcriptional regulator
MPRVSNTVDQARTLLERRLRELDDERKQVEAALAGLGRSARRRVGRPRGAGGTTTRRRRGSTRADQAVRIIKQNPGITVSELGRKMKLNHPNYLYRVLPDLQKEGRIKRQGKGYTA